MRTVAVLIKLLVYLIKAALSLALVAEYLDDLLPVHHLLRVALCISYRALLTDEVLSRAAADLL